MGRALELAEECARLIGEKNEATAKGDKRANKIKKERKRANGKRMKTNMAILGAQLSQWRHLEHH
eukprot:7101103-Pyramimonas_sp.AAC.1